MSEYRLAFTDPPADLPRAPQSDLVGQGDPPVYVFPADGGIEFKGPGGAFLLRARSCDALEQVWLEWRAQILDF